MRTVGTFLLAFLSGCVMTVGDLTEFELTGNETVMPIEPAAAAIRSVSQVDPELPTNRLSLSRGSDGRIAWNAPDGFVYSIAPDSVRAGVWGVIHDTSDQPVMAYYWSGNIDSVLALSIDGANSQTFVLGYRKAVPDRVVYLGADDGNAAWNPLNRPAIFLRAGGRRDDAPLRRGDSFDILTVEPEKYLAQETINLRGDLTVAGRLKTENDLVAERNQTGSDSGIRSTYRRPEARGKDVVCPPGEFVKHVRILDTDNGRYCTDCVSHISVVCAKP